MNQTMLTPRFSPGTLTDAALHEFQNVIYSYYQNHERKFPWRMTREPYHILVSEIMLQQTQTDRTVKKYEQFITAFPDFARLAKAPLHTVLKVWQGLGYNRRAKALKTIAETVVSDYNGVLPSTVDELITLPGIGPYSAAAICAFAYDQPTVLIETNIRTVYIHFFYHDKSGVTDEEIKHLVDTTMDRTNPRIWYYALMDYGVMLKKHHPQLNKKSAHYHKQSRFQGSNRQLRGMILRELVAHPGQSSADLAQSLSADEQKIGENLTALEREGLIVRKGKTYRIGEK